MVKAIIKIIDEDTNAIKGTFETQPSIISYRIEHSERHVKYKFNFNYEEVEHENIQM